MSKSYRLVTLHEHPEFLDQCADLLNTEWKRSYGMRSRNLKQSNPDFPCNLALLEKEGENESVVGHARLSGVVGENNALYLSSVIITEEKRGQGLGRKMLELLEEFVKPQGFGCLYLNAKSTPFYEKSGYIECSPVQEYTTKEMEERIIQLQDCFSRKRDETVQQEMEEQDLEKEVAEKKVSNNHNVFAPPPNIPPPPPPPPLLPISTEKCVKRECTPDHECQCPFWMKKLL